MTALHVSARAARVPPFHAMAMGRAASAREAAGHRVLHLEIGQPSTGAPRPAIDAVTGALGSPLGYTDADGLVMLRRRIARHYLDEHGVTVDAGRIVAVAGASAGFTLAFLAGFDAGARVGVIEPGYPCYRNTLHALDMEPVPIAVGADSRWAPTPAMLDAVGPLDGLIVASPSNPTGTVLDPVRLDELIAHCDTREIRLVADEIYHGIAYGPEPAPTVLGRTADAIVVNSFSKYFSMTGWRIGWVVAPESMTDAFVRLQQNLYVCAAHVSQVAATAAMDARDELDAHVARYAANRSIVLDGLAGAGLTDIAEADGAFYVYADVGDLVDGLGDPAGSMALCRRWLDEIGVACTPGIDFDLARGHRFVRFSYAGATDDVGEACGLIADWIGRHL